MAQSIHSTEQQFPDVPPFPDTVPTAPLLRISLIKLLAHDAEEEQRLWNACCDLGFFYLDLRPGAEHAGGNGTNGNDQKANGSNGTSHDAKTVDGQRLLSDADALFKVAAEFFDLPVEEKQKYDFTGEGNQFGYKGYGTSVIDQQGTRDRSEFYKVSKDDVYGITQRLPAPGLFDKHRSLLGSYIENAHSLISLILRLLTPRLQLSPGYLENLHEILSASGDQVRFIKAPPQPADDRKIALGAHTDFGSVTVLFNRLGGLQVRLPEGIEAVPAKTPGQMTQTEKNATEGGWAYVHPLPGHAIINLGDALVKFSAGILRSNIHRIAIPPGAQGDVVRYSLVYFSRPVDEVLLRPLRDSPLIDRQAGPPTGEEEFNSKEWILRRVLSTRPGKYFDLEKAKGTEDIRGPRG